MGFIAFYLSFVMVSSSSISHVSVVRMLLENGIPFQNWLVFAVDTHTKTHKNCTGQMWNTVYMVVVLPSDEYVTHKIHTAHNTFTIVVYFISYGNCYSILIHLHSKHNVMDQPFVCFCSALSIYAIAEERVSCCCNL